jgi:enterochelin esterase-like enzyme
MRQLATLAAALLIGSVNAQTQSPPATSQAPPAEPAPQAAPPRPTPPTRAVDGPGAPKFTMVPRGNPPVNTEGDFVIGPDYVAAPELTANDSVPIGHMTQFTMYSNDSKYYPGITRDVFGTPDPDNPKALIVKTRQKDYQRTITVYMPAQLKPRRRVPFIVTHDGPKLGEPDTVLPRILDNLIAQKRVPVMVAIMIQNGGGDAQGSERGLEYDTMSGKFAEFIEAEVLPAVERSTGLMLSRKGKDRAVMGCSSGAAAAFTMAWNHPEWYQRVISYSGTYVNQQWPYNATTPGGAWEYHNGIIAGSPAKPIRVWMQVGDRDLYNPNVMRDDMHDWVAANHRFAAALKQKGYHYQYVFALDSTHCDKRVREQTLPEALEFVWK